MVVVMTIIAAADGSALGNPGPAGWAWYIDDSRWRAGGWEHGTNNMGELKAVLDLLESTAHVDEPLQILCDSQYVINSITTWMPGWKKRGWKKKDGKPVLNIELMQALDAALTDRDVTFEWVKGHAGHPLNEAADARANAAAKAFQAGQKPDQGPGLEHRDESLTSLKTPEQEALECELRRLHHGVSSSAIDPQALLIGIDGRPIEPESMGVGDPDADVHVVQTLTMGSQAVLISTHVVGRDPRTQPTVQASLWTLEKSGTWLLSHYQATAET